MPETVVDLGRKVKAKYPGQYDDLSDIELGRKVKAKYSEYADFTDVSENLTKDASGKVVDRRASGNPAIVAAQAKKFPSSQEEGRGGAGKDDTAAGRFITTYGLAADRSNALAHPQEFVQGIPRMLQGMVDPKNSALQASAARERGAENPDPYGTLPLADAAVRGDLPAVGGEVAGQLTGQALTAAELGVLVKAGAAAIPPMLRKAGNVVTSPTALDSSAANLRLPAKPVGLGVELAVPSTAGVVGHALFGPEGAAAFSGGAETVLRLKQSPMFRNLAANQLEKVARFLEGPPPVRAARMAALEAEFQRRGSVEQAVNDIPDSPAITKPVSRDAMGQPTEPYVQALREVETPEQAFNRMRAMQDDQAGMSRAPLDVEGTRSLPTPGELETGTPPKNPLPTPQEAVPGPPTSADTNKWLNVKESQLMFGKNPGERILSENLLGPDKQTTLQNVTAARKAAGASMDEAFKAAEAKGIRFNAEEDINAAVADAKKTYGKRTDKAFTDALDNLQDDFVRDNPDLKSLTPSETHEFEKNVGKGVSWQTSATTDVSKFMKDLRSRINKKLKTVEGIGDLKDRWGDLFEGEKSLQSSIRKDKAGRGSGEVFNPK